MNRLCVNVARKDILSTLKESMSLRLAHLAMENKTNMDIVTVTGGSGFLGQHIVKMLQERADYVSEIRVLDLVQHKNLLSYDENLPVSMHQGSITDINTITEAFKGSQSVIHVAGLISFGTFPDTTAMEAINVQGTQNIIQSCLDANVERLVFCSTVDVVIGHDAINNGDETTPIPKSFLFPGYPESKYRAECLVRKASGQKCKNGRYLKTAILRANVMYGELDPYYVTNGLQSAKANNNILYQVGNGTAKFQQTYVGNSAWAFICADKSLRENKINSGEVFFIPDNTPVQNTFRFMRIFLETRHMQLSKYKIPYSLVYYPVLLLEWILYMLAPIYKVNLPVVGCSIKYINMNLYFSGRKARDQLGYEPVYTPEESISRSLKYYASVKLK